MALTELGATRHGPATDPPRAAAAADVSRPGRAPPPTVDRAAGRRRRGRRPGVVVALWLSGGALDGLPRRRRPDDRARPAVRPDRLLPAAHPGAADGENPVAGGHLGTGRAGPATPAGRLHLLPPDARAHRHDHPRLRGGRPNRRAARDLGAGHGLPGDAAGHRRHRWRWSRLSSPRSGRPAAGCGTSPGT